MAHKQPEFPTEIKAHIASYISYTGDMYNLLITNSVFFDICRPALYKSKVLGALQKDRTVKWCKAIISNSLLAGFVQEIKIDYFITPGGAPYLRLLIKSLHCLTNLQSLNILDVDWFRLIYHLPQFPMLKEFTYRGEGFPLGFLEQHPSIETFAMYEAFSRPHPHTPHSKPWLSLPNTGVLPNLTSYCGPTSVLWLVTGSAPLWQVADYDPDPNSPQPIWDLLSKYGNSLRWLELGSYSWAQGSFDQVSEAAPQLEHLELWIEENHVTDEPPRSLGGFLHDAVSAKLPMHALQSLILGEGLELETAYSDQLQIVQELVQTSCPALTFVAFLSFWRKDKARDVALRYSRIKDVWMAPPREHDWWSFQAPRLGITKDDYYAVWPFSGPPPLDRDRKFSVWELKD